jgi:hypothetical protein
MPLIEMLVILIPFNSKTLLSFYPFKLLKLPCKTNILKSEFKPIYTFITLVSPFKPA